MGGGGYKKVVLLLLGLVRVARMSGPLYTSGGTVPFIMWGWVFCCGATPGINCAYYHCLSVACICIMFLAICLVCLEYILNKSSFVVFKSMSGSVCIAGHSSSMCCWVSGFWPHPLHIVSLYMFL